MRSSLSFQGEPPPGRARLLRQTPDDDGPSAVAAPDGEEPSAVVAPDGEGPSAVADTGR